jgi:Cu2+-containing amine oxidase
MQYRFRDDGSVEFRLGATANNLLDGNALEFPGNIHIHLGCWRVEVALRDEANDVGAPSHNVVQLVRRFETKELGSPFVAVSSFNSDREGGVVWKPEEFTTIRIQSLELTNHHRPESKVAYDFIAHRTGSSRQFGEGEEFTQNDFWVTRKPFDDKVEDKYRLVSSYANGQGLSGFVPVVWHCAPAQHIPRDEDFGEEGYHRKEGVATTAWASFELRPRNLFAKTPLFP